MEKVTMEIIHDLMITDHMAGVLLGNVFAFDLIVSTFPKLNLQKQKVVINKLLKFKVDMEENIVMLEEQMATLQSHDKAVHLFLNRNYQDDVRALKKGIALVDAMLK